MRWANVFFMSDEKSGFVHPCGDGHRKLLTILNDADRYSVTTLYPPSLEAKTFTSDAWAAIAHRAEYENIIDPKPVLARLVARRDNLSALKVSFDREVTDRAIGILTAMLAPAPRPRVRTRSA